MPGRLASSKASVPPAITAALANPSARRALSARTVAWTTSVADRPPRRGIDEVVGGPGRSLPSMDAGPRRCKPQGAAGPLRGKIDDGEQAVGITARISDPDGPRVPVGDPRRDVAVGVDHGGLPRCDGERAIREPPLRDAVEVEPQGRRAIQRCPTRQPQRATTASLRQAARRSACRPRPRGAHRASRRRCGHRSGPRARGPSRGPRSVSGRWGRVRRRPRSSA